MKIPILRLNYSQKDISFIKNGIVKVLKSGYLTMGKRVEEFEKLFANFIGTKYAVATQSGISALEVILRAIGCEGKSVIIPSITFMATATTIVHAGGKVIFADVTKEDLSIDPEDLKKKIRKDTKAVVLVHIGGIISKNFYKIKKICQKNKIFLIEDAAHAFGSNIDGKMAGTLGIAAAFSFYPTKVITTAEGGMITTNNKDIYRKAKILRDHGKKDEKYNIHTEFGYNWRFSEIHAVLGLQQMKRAKKIIRERQKIARYYDRELKGIDGVELIKIPANIKSSYYKYILYLKRGISPEKIKREMLKKYDISLVGEVYRDPLYSQPVFKKYPGFKLNKINEVFPNSQYVASRQICLPLYPGLKKKELEYIVESFKKLIKNTNK
jgi:dTDP-4-amino-4,6-dideoxygalactose transaminase